MDQSFRMRACSNREFTMGGHSTAGWYVYMIRTAGGRLYTGITTDVTRRWREHCAGKAGAKFFRSDRAEALCLVEGGLNRSTAAQREAQIKKLAPAQKWRLVRCQGPVALVPPAVEATK